MDRFDALVIFIAVAEQGSFIGAARKLGRSPASVTRAIAELEDRVSIRLLNRTTRSVALTDAGARYLEHSRRLLSDFEDMETSLDDEARTPKGLLTLTAPVVFGRLHVMPIVHRYLHEYPSTQVSAFFLDRVVSIVDEGIDLAIRIGHLPDSSLQAIRVGSVKRVICASPSYLSLNGTPRTPRDIDEHGIIAVTGINQTPNRWSFSENGATITLSAKARLTVNSIQVALDAAVAHGGLTSLLSYQTAELEQQGQLVRVLTDFEPPAVPIHIVHPSGHHLSLKVRRFIDMAAASLRQSFGEGPFH